MSTSVALFWVPPLPWRPSPLPPPAPQPEPPAFHWNHAEPTVYQQQNWSCSCAAAAWVWNACGLRTSLGHPYNEFDVIQLLRSLFGFAAVTPDYGLAFGDMHQLQGAYQSVGLTTQRQLRLTYFELLQLAGVFPAQINGAAWNHHSGLRDSRAGNLILANPAPTWKNVQQDLDPLEFAQWGPFSILYVTGFA